MSKNKFLKNIFYIFRNIRSWYRVMERKLRRSLWNVINNRSRYSGAGFVLPTVTMVLLVVVLLSIAILLRSFDRAEMARNVKVNQQVLSAAAPALERASAKIDYLLNADPSLPKGTPTDDLLSRTMSPDEDLNTEDRYTFGDETALKVKFDIDGDGFEVSGEDDLLEDDEQITTAWRYPVDTDNNGNYDSYTLYGIFFRSPTRDTESGEFNRERTPLEARTPPQSPFDSLGNPGCEGASGTSFSLVGNSGWFKSGSNLRKSFFVYTATVPITDTTQAGLISAKDQSLGKDFENYSGTTGFSALEYQQDYERKSVANNAVVYESDLEAAPGFEFNINGRILASSNLMLMHFDEFKIYQVSGRSSCFYEAENSKILVGGQLINGRTRKVDDNPDPVTVHLFQGKDNDPIKAEIKDGDTESINKDSSPLDAAYNEQAYRQRIAAMVNAVIDTPGNYPPEVTKQVKDLVDNGTSEEIARQQALEAYFKERTRKVPFKEVALGADALDGKTGAATINGDGESLRPIDEWMFPTTFLFEDNPKVGTKTTNSGLDLLLDRPPATNPDNIVDDVEQYLGDRILVGNNLPLKRYDKSQDPPQFVGEDTTQQVDGATTWDDDDTPRTRTTQIQELADLGNPDRNGFWELAAAQEPESAVDGYGGLRVITGAGVYERQNSFLPPPNIIENGEVKKYDDPATTVIEEFKIVWPDTMPMSPIENVPGSDPPEAVVGSMVYDNVDQTWRNLFNPDTETTTVTDPPTIDPNTPKYAKGDLRMRATAVYHYAESSYEKGTTPTQTPIACVSSYYDPTSEETAENFDATTAPNGKSNNGIVYGPPTYTVPGKSTEDSTSKLLGGTSPSILENQANLVFPNGRFVNGPLRTALLKDADDRNLVDQAAIHSTACALGILGTPGFSTVTSNVIPDGAIKEVAFLDGRQIKAIDADDPATPNDETFTLSSNPNTTPANLTGNYDLSLEERQPLEVRVTQLDLNVLRNTTIAFGTTNVGPKPEYLLPNSGIIYASRDDALPDRSDRTEFSADGIDEDTSKLLSPTDWRLDPTRRPNGIMLVNGEKLSRNDNNNVIGETDNEKIESIVKEKGLILVTNLPAYIQGDFNLHDHGEFQGAKNIDWDFNAYYNPNKKLDTSFACRIGDPRISGFCPEGDNWRAATVLSDSISLLSGNFRPGFRNEGDFDLRNNVGNIVTEGYDLSGDGNINNDVNENNTLDADDEFEFTEQDLLTDLDKNGTLEDTVSLTFYEEEVTTKLARLLNGFYANNFVTNGLSSNVVINSNPALEDNDYRNNEDNAVDSSYFNNFTTPVQRRGEFTEYLTEICLKLPVSACQPSDWVVLLDNNGDGTLTPGEIISANTLSTSTSITINDLWSGTTAEPPRQEYQRFPRRVAFLRYLDQLTPNVPKEGWNKGAAANVLVLQNDNETWRPVPIGVASKTGGNLKLSYYPYSATLKIDDTSYSPYDTANPPVEKNALWFHTTNGGKLDSGYNFPLYFEENLTQNTVKQPLLMPVLQIHATRNQAAATGNAFPTNNQKVDQTRWLPQAADTTFNLILATGDVPSRILTDTEGETNGGLPNLPRFLENWKDRTATISGSFIQLRRSEYGTAPYQQVLPFTTPNLFNSDDPDALNTYNSTETNGQVPFFMPPTRQWNFDVGLLSQSPDLFALKLTGPPSESKPDEYYREVSRDDEWVETLLCSLTEDDSKAVNDNLRPDNCIDN
ncbi:MULTISPECIES: hormogonium polysaccharide biosynthesis protein HpsA [unclassified Okeania]|uniref:hormogonium polysaccharide biosynthesis protein HpsA n=1 Tax=unclassified Okeania TaxID=2634635 RepID=UPI0013BA1215|nr:MULTISPECIES: hormogonium polysaccharide biosynthesis protein HpsA [unclassified Okeania]NES78857.1 hypothetical protein [Okeania sp. SIO1H4]NET22831.1 hypothetical protein [Okeania sp. SIO1H5]NET95790.1 hypothetical protein [Okeania sp. SIO1H2]